MESGHEVREVMGSGVSCTNGSQSRTINGVQVETLDEILLRHNWERFADFEAILACGDTWREPGRHGSRLGEGGG